MEFIQQRTEDILSNLQSLQVNWQDDVAKRVISRLEQIPAKRKYSSEDVGNLLSGGFDDGLLISRLFLGLSDDTFTAVLADALEGGGVGAKRYRDSPAEFVNALVDMGLLDAMGALANKPPRWTDVLVERLRSGRGRAISGQRRGRGLEDFAEKIVAKVFPKSYAVRCKFVGARKQTAKCDLAIPSKENPRILVEVKGYGATGSKMSDVVGDIDAIIRAKRPDTNLLLLTDGITWRRRQSDLRKLVERQNEGLISRIYTTSMADQLEQDLRTLKQEHRI